MAYYFDLINPFTINVANVYLNFVWLIDPLLAFVIFLSIAQWVFKKKYEGREGKILAVAIALALTFGFIVFEQRSGFFFGQLQGLAALILMFIFGVFIFELLHGLFGKKKKACAFALTYVLVYGIFMSVTQPSFHDLMYSYPLVAAILNIGFLVAFIKLMMCLFGMFSDRKKEDEPPDQAHPEEHPEKKDEGPTLKLTVDITSPKFKQAFEGGQQIPVQATIKGGKGDKYIWRVHGTFDERYLQSASGSGAQAGTIINPLPKANYQVTVSAFDGTSWANAQTVFSVGEAKADLAVTTSRAQKFIKDAERFAAAVKAFEKAQGQLAHVNAAAAHGQSAPVSLVDATRAYTQYAQALDAILRELIDGLKVLTTDPNYPDITAELAGHVGRAYTTYATAATELDRNHHAFQEFFNLNASPSSPMPAQAQPANDAHTQPAPPQPPHDAANGGNH